MNSHQSAFQRILCLKCPRNSITRSATSWQQWRNGMKIKFSFVILMLREARETFEIVSKKSFEGLTEYVLLTLGSLWSRIPKDWEEGKRPRESRLYARKSWWLRVQTGKIMFIFFYYFCSVQRSLREQKHTAMFTGLSVGVLFSPLLSPFPY